MFAQRQAVILFALLLPMSAVASPLVAQERDPLTPLVEEAWRVNLGFAGARLAERRAAAEVQDARARLLPTVALESRYSRLDGVFDIGELVNPAYAALNGILGVNRFPTNLSITLPQRHDSRLELRQPLFNAGILANYSAVRSRHRGEEFALRAAARQLAADVQLGYLASSSAGRAVEIYTASLDLARENERVAERLLAAGRGTAEALYRARADRSEVEQRLAEAHQRHRAAVQAVNQLLRRPLESPLPILSDTLLDLTLPLDVDSAVAHALENRDELEQMGAGIAEGEAGVRGATGAFLPALTLAVDYGFQGRDLSFTPAQDYWVASLVVSWNLFNGGSDVARRSAARLEADRLRTLQTDLADRIALQVRVAYDAAVVARAAIATADDHLEAARRTYQLVRRRYEEGMATPIELVDARTVLTSAELNRVVTTYGFAMRRVDLERVAALRTLTF